MSLCSDAEFDVNINDAIGEPTECALVNYAEKLGLSKNEKKKEYPRIGEVPFDSMRKMMTTVHGKADGVVQFTKGAPDEILKRCTSAIVNGNVVPMTDEIRAEILKANKSMADQALRVLAAAKKDLDVAPAVYEAEAVENEICFVGLERNVDHLSLSLNRKGHGLRAFTNSGVGKVRGIFPESCSLQLFAFFRHFCRRCVICLAGNNAKCARKHKHEREKC
jgi:hypothetical protein